MIYELKEIRIAGLVMKVHERVEIPPDVIEFRDQDGNLLGRIIDLEPPPTTKAVNP